MKSPHNHLVVGLLTVLMTGVPPAFSQDKTPSSKTMENRKQQPQQSTAAQPSGQTKPQKDQGGQPSAQSQQARSMTAPNVEHAVRQKLQKLDGIDASKVEIKNLDGTVTVTGTVKRLPDSDRILETIGAVRGVENVIVSLTVEPESRPDNTLQQDVMAALKADPAMANIDPDISVKNGVVTLQGKAQSWGEKRLARQLASEVRGVREVRNELAVASSQKSDQEIKQAVEQRFASDPRISDGITVEVQNRKVILSGQIGSAVERDWAISDARGAGGIEVDTSGLKVNPAGRSSRQAQGLSDTEIKNAITSAYLGDPRVASFNPTVEVKDGEVTLNGAVANAKAKQAAVQLAENTRGVTKVTNNLSVRVDSRSDSQIAQDLNQALERSSLVDAGEVTAQVETGKVTLTGTVDSNLEKWSAEDIAARTRGVTEIENRLQIGDTPVIAVSEYYYYPWHSSFVPWTFSSELERKTDAELLDDVSSQLFWSPFVDSDDISVSVDNGIVTLSGSVDDRMERGAAMDNAYQAGARDVQNRITVLQPTGR